MSYMYIYSCPPNLDFTILKYVLRGGRKITENLLMQLNKQI